MMPSIFESLFTNTNGNICVMDPDSKNTLLTRDHTAILRFTIAFPNSVLVPVTDHGECVAIFIHGDGHAMHPPPSVPSDLGGLYLNDGEPIPDQEPGKLLIPVDSLGELEACEFYSLADLTVWHVPALDPPEAGSPKIDPALLEGKSADEQRHLRELNDRVAVGMLGHKLRIIHQPDKSKPPKFLSVSDARELEATRVVRTKEGDKKNMFNEWKGWEGRRVYDTIAFAPHSNDPSVFNLFSGWSVKPSRGDWSLLRNHIKDVVCSGNDEQFGFFIAWLAHIFQFPDQKPRVAVVIRGKKGTGKSIVFDFIQQLMPDYFYKVADGNRALGNFNAPYETTLLLLMEEAFWAGDRAKEAGLKDLITSPTIAIERKGVDPYMAKNHMRIAMISNDRWVVPATDDERRYAIFDCSDKHRGDKAYFEAIFEQMRNGGLEAMLYDLVTYEPDAGWESINTAPATSGLREQIIESLRGIDRFMHDLLKSGMYECDDMVEGGIFLDEDCGISISMKDMRIAVRDYLADQYPGQKAASYDLIARSVNEWFGAEVVTRKAQQNAVRWIEFPTLTDARAHVRRSKGIEIDAPVRLPPGSRKENVVRLRSARRSG